MRYDLPSHRIVEERTVGSADVIGVIGIETICITPVETASERSLRHVARVSFKKCLDVCSLKGLDRPTTCLGVG